MFHGAHGADCSLVDDPFSLYIEKFSFVRAPKNLIDSKIFPSIGGGKWYNMANNLFFLPPSLFFSALSLSLYLLLLFFCLLLCAWVQYRKTADHGTFFCHLFF